MPATNTDSDMDRYVCLECSYIYDLRKGDPTQGIPPGTPFRKLPTTWRCPECKISLLKAGVFKKLPVEVPKKEETLKRGSRSKKKKKT